MQATTGADLRNVSLRGRGQVPKPHGGRLQKRHISETGRRWEWGLRLAENGHKGFGEMMQCSQTGLWRWLCT